MPDTAPHCSAARGRARILLPVVWVMRSGCSFFALRRLSKHFTDRRGVVGQTTPRHITATPQRCASSRRHAPAAVVVPSSAPARPRRRRRANATDRTLAGAHERVDGADECVRRLLVWHVTAASQLDLPCPPTPVVRNDARRAYHRRHSRRAVVERGLWFSRRRDPPDETRCAFASTRTRARDGTGEGETGRESRSRPRRSR